MNGLCICQTEFSGKGCNNACSVVEADLELCIDPSTCTGIISANNVIIFYNLISNYKNFYLNFHKKFLI